MEIISHRGLWRQNSEKNSISSFIRSFEFNFGTETDVRDYMGRLVISHDIAESNSVDLDEFFKLYNLSCVNTLALNIKSDGLTSVLKNKLESHTILNYFVFDMSIPDTFNYINEKVNFYIRQSEYENDLPFYNECKGIWLDCFNSIWYDDKIILNHFDNGKKVCLVSPELHKRNHYQLWEILYNTEIYKSTELILCTDYPMEANKFFYNEN